MSTLMPETFTAPQFGGVPQPAWLWPLRIPMGKITLLAGDPGLGKSFIALDIAARLSTASPMPCTSPPSPGIPSPGSESPCHQVSLSPCHPAATLLLSAEDELHDTILPRLAALHADPDRIIPLRCLDSHQQTVKSFSLKKQLYEISWGIEEHAAELVILDPITAFMRGIDLNSTSAIRQYLTPLAQLAAFYHVAILAITHLNKQPHRTQSLYRATGSLALAAIARTVHLVHPLHSLPSVPQSLSAFVPSPIHLLSPIKSNLTTSLHPLPFRLTDNRIDWLPDDHPSLTQHSEFSIQNSPPDFYESHDRQLALDFLRESLAPGPQPAIPLIRQAKSLAISERTLRRAKAELGILSKRPAPLTPWYWLLPTQSLPI